MGGTTEDDLSLSAAAVGNASSLVRFPLVVMLLFRARLRDRKVDRSCTQEAMYCVLILPLCCALCDVSKDPGAFYFLL